MTAPGPSTENMTLEFRLIKARHLAPKDITGKSDPFIKWTVDGKKKPKSKIIKQNLNPEWNEIYYWEGCTERTVIRGEMWDHDLVGKDFMGWFQVDAADMMIAVMEPVEKWFTLHKRSSKDNVTGEVLIRLQFKEKPNPNMDADALKAIAANAQNGTSVSASTHPSVPMSSSGPGTGPADNYQFASHSAFSQPPSLPAQNSAYTPPDGGAPPPPPPPQGRTHPVPTHDGTLVRQEEAQHSAHNLAAGPPSLPPHPEDGTRSLPSGRPPSMPLQGPPALPPGHPPSMPPHSGPPSLPSPNPPSLPPHGGASSSPPSHGGPPSHGPPKIPTGHPPSHPPPHSAPPHAPHPSSNSQGGLPKIPPPSAAKPPMQPPSMAPPSIPPAAPPVLPPYVPSPPVDTPPIPHRALPTPPQAPPTIPEKTSVRAIFDYTAANPTEISLSVGSVYTIDKEEDGWYQGRDSSSGTFGWFPGNYVEKI